jgi:putative Holliday junction resolvase
MRVLALDHGAARCGVAISDPSGTLATPVGIVERPDSNRGLDAIAALVREHDAERVVVGLPLSLSGGDSAQTAAARAFAARLAERLAVPVELYDERFTTTLAQRTPGAAAEDARAAAVLLEGWLEGRT